MRVCFLVGRSRALTRIYGASLSGIVSELAQRFTRADSHDCDQRNHPGGKSVVGGCGRRVPSDGA